MTSRVFLVGFMGSGKSTIGKILAEHLGYQFIDLDVYIETIRQISITELFKQYGEQGFRAIEKECLHDLINHQNIVVACGGGTPCFFDNIDWMKKIGIVVFLSCTAEQLYDRLKSEQAHRPLIQDFEPEALKHFISKKLQERLPFYTQANIQLFEMNDKQANAHWIQEILQST